MNTLSGKLPTASTRLAAGCRRKRWSASRPAFLVAGARSVHTVHTRRELPYPIENGVGDFLPPKALETVVEWQDGLLQRLNEQVRGTHLALPTVLQIIIDSAGDQKYIRAFNYACLAANNSFFLDNLKPPGPDPNETGISPDFGSSLASHFSDLESLKERFVAAASGMVSSGWLWLVTDGQGRLAVIPTFGAGTLLVRSKCTWNYLEQVTLVRQPLDWSPGPLEGESGTFPPSQDGPMPTSPVSGIRAGQPKLNPHSPARSISSSATASDSASYSSVRNDDALSGGLNGETRRQMALQTGAKLYPLCCLSLFEHTWISAGLGVWGKEEYVRRYFSVINWQRVSETFTKFRDQLGSREVS